MFPNPQDALPLPRHPNLDQYRKLAKDLRKACGSGPDALGVWTRDWLDRLIDASGLEISPGMPVEPRGWVDKVEAFARSHLGNHDCALTAAQFVLARAHGFQTWPKFTKHIRALEEANSPGSQFERAANAIVDGDEALLAQLLRDDPDVVRRRSTREHGAALLHYVSANGIEGYRQKTPPNAVVIATMLLDGGADVNATCEVYGGHCTTLGLTATSVHPERAGVQQQLMQLLLDRGAVMETPGIAGHHTPLVVSCFANGQPAAATFLAARGAPLDLEGAAGVGRLDVVETFFDAKRTLKRTATKQQLQRGLLWACFSGHDEVVDYLLERGADVHDPAGIGEAPLHMAVMGARISTIKLLLAHGASLEALNAYGGTALGQAAWSFEHGDRDADYVPVFEVLLEAGARLGDGWLPWLERVKKRSPDVKERVAGVLRRYGIAAR